MANVHTVIGIDSVSGNIRFLTQTDTPDTAQIKTIPFKARALSDEFYKEFEQILNEYVTQNPATYQSAISMVLPDNSVYLDSIRMPIIRGKKLNTSIDIALSNLFVNTGDLNINKQQLQSEQFITVFIACMRKALTQGIYSACSLNKMMPKNMTFRANATVQTFAHIHPKLAGSSFILVDIKEHSCHMSLVCKGKTVGYYSLPFGYTILKSNRLAAEDMLFDHTLAEITVLNAREKAKAKALTVIESQTMDSDDEESDAPSVSASTSATPAPQLKKQARKLPKFMLRPQPESEEDYINENFRIFMRRILLFKMRNETLWEATDQKAVYVNLPSEFSGVIEYANLEKEENGIEFKLMTTASDHCPKNLLLYPELFGVLYANKHNTINHF